MEQALSLQLSQAHLQMLSLCPRKFQYSVLEQGLPRLKSTSEQQQLGTQFHQLMQQHELGLNIQPLLADNPRLERWFEQFQQSPPPMVSGLRQSEHQRTLPWLGITLVVVYDLLIQGSQAQIVDWKTYRRPHQLQQLKDHWQTRIYPFILAETSDYPPEHISMTYWFAEASESGDHSVQFPYSAALHKQTRNDLETMLLPLQPWIQGIQQPPLPQVPESAGLCHSETQRCAFVHRCGRAPDANESRRLQLSDIGAMAEIPL